MTDPVTLPSEYVQAALRAIDEYATGCSEMGLKAKAESLSLLYHNVRAILSRAGEGGSPSGRGPKLPIDSMPGCWRYDHPSWTGAYFDCPKCRAERRFILIGPRWHRCWDCRYEFGDSPEPRPETR